MSPAYRGVLLGIMAEGSVDCLDEGKDFAACQVSRMYIECCGHFDSPVYPILEICCKSVHE
jgi:hypothetical protein